MEIPWNDQVFRFLSLKMLRHYMLKQNLHGITASYTWQFFLFLFVSLMQTYNCLFTVQIWSSVTFRQVKFGMNTNMIKPIDSNFKINILIIFGEIFIVNHHLGTIKSDILLCLISIITSYLQWEDTYCPSILHKKKPKTKYLQIYTI